MKGILQGWNVKYEVGRKLPALAPVAATHTGLKRMPVMNVQKID
jgi:hypothetical protein